MEVAQSIFGLGLNAIAMGSYPAALTALEHALALRIDIMNSLGRSVHIDVEVSKVWLAQAYCLMCRYDDAKPLVTNAGKTLCNLLGNKHTKVADGLCVLGEMLCCRGRYKDAKKLFTAAIETNKKILGPTHPDVARMIVSYSENVRLTGYIQAAGELSAEALNARMVSVGTANPIFAMSLHNRALILRDAGDLDRAEQFIPGCCLRVHCGWLRRPWVRAVPNLLSSWATRENVCGNWGSSICLRTSWRRRGRRARRCLGWSTYSCWRPSSTSSFRRWM